ncbi:NifB/NifX family molybdenum-iron cluster-binding protein [uncultured Sunxiuqinia sp.]|uniref:NifB/NifX family molybdenum-iron cluster-binding protein n=1 Tax=uncultured Sunxiuqinia sp. TaxID=1573825 RepID=UPI002AA86C96|nr:NifB/NifX family molybdenum-iron cluster-binding protein [uncultured Sunxiuqinia sp.]
MKIRLAFAVNRAEVFEQKHFGEAEKFLIYKWEANQLVFQQAIENPLVQTPLERHSPEKAELLISLLKEQGINILVSKQFGKNIKRVNALFVPVQVGTSSPDELFPILKKQMRWIEEELLQNAGNYKLFNLQKGTIKTAVNSKN